MIDLDDIERRIKDGIEDLDGPGYSGIADDACAALAEIIAEVERLRSEVSYLRACVPPTHPSDYGHEAWAETVRTAVGAERAAVVAWLRRRTRSGRRRAFSPAFITDAAAIERGEHRLKERK